MAQFALAKLRGTVWFGSAKLKIQNKFQSRLQIKPFLVHGTHGHVGFQSDELFLVFAPPKAYHIAVCGDLSTNSAGKLCSNPTFHKDVPWIPLHLMPVQWYNLHTMVHHSTCP